MRKLEYYQKLIPDTLIKPKQIPDLIQTPISRRLTRQKPVQDIIQKELQLITQTPISKQSYSPLVISTPSTRSSRSLLLGMPDVEEDLMKSYKPKKRTKKELKTGYLPSFIAISEKIYAKKGFKGKGYVGSGLEIRPLLPPK